LAGGGALGLLGLLASGLCHRRAGLVVRKPGHACSATLGLGGQFGIGLGGALVLLALLMLMGAGMARLGYFRGDIFVAGAVVLCAALLLLFVALPVAKSLIGAFLDESRRAVSMRRWPNAWATTASGACPAWSAACAAAWPGTRSSWR
jgi:iron(III) transport system permease protein